MKIFCSFTNTLRRFLAGQITGQELAWSIYGTEEEPILFSFNCQREHVLRQDGLLPCEATWSNPDRETVNYGTSAEEFEVAPDLLKKVKSFIRLIECADCEGRVLWDSPVGIIRSAASRGEPLRLG